MARTIPFILQNAQYFKNLTRYNFEDRQIGSSPWGSYCYITKGIASLDSTIIDIYFLFFKSAYNKQYKNNTIQKRHRRALKEKYLSQFYKSFIECICITSTISTTNPITVQNKIKVFQQQLSSYKNDPQLLDITIKLIGQNLTNLKQYIERQHQKQNRLIYLQLKVKYQAIRQKLLSENKIIKIKQTQYLPTEINTIEQIRYFIRRTFQRIQNIYAPEIHKRQNLILRFCSEMKSNLGLSLLYFDHKKYKDDPNYKNYIIMNKNSNVDQTFLSEYDQYLSFQTIINQKIGPLRFQLIKDVFILLKEFYKNARLAYPYFKVHDLFFNQKTLKPQIKKAILIFQGLGLHKNTDSIEIQVSCNCTPSPIEFQKCYKQFDNQFIWQFQKKYYCPNLIIQDQQQKVQQLLQTIQLYQNVDVWRILCIIYYTLNKRQHYIKSQYNFKYKHQFHTKEKEDPPFYIDRYQQLLKQLYANLKNNPKELQKILTNKDLNNKNIENIQMRKILPKQQQNNFQFNFTMKQLQYYLGIENTQDSLIEKLQFQTIKSQFYVRHVIGKQILNLAVNQKYYFARMINIKKYVIMFNVAIIQAVYQIAFTIWSEQKKPGSRKVIMTNVKYYRNINFQKQQITRNLSIQNSIKKARQYNQRQPKDQQRIYLKNNELIRNNFENAYQNYILISQKLNELKNYELSITATTNHQQSSQLISKYKDKIDQIQTLAEKVINGSYQALRAFLKTDLIPKKQNILEFHKLDEAAAKSKKHQRLYQLITEKLITLIQSFLKLTTKNWREYQFFLLNCLIEDKKNTSQKSTVQKNKEDAKQESIQSLENNLQIARQFLSLEDEITNYKQLKNTHERDLQKYNQTYKNKKVNKQQP